MTTLLPLTVAFICGLVAGFLVSILVEAQWIVDHFIEFKEDSENTAPNDEIKVVVDQSTHEVVRYEWKDWDNHPA